VSTEGEVAQNEAGGVVSPSAQTHQTFFEAERHIDFAADHVIERLPIGNPKELRG
jgi:hypothetical protein